MTLSDVANISSLASAIAVLVSLIYLTIQVRQSERNQRAIISQAVATRAVENMRWSAEADPAALRARVMAGDSSFTSQEVMQLCFILRATIVVNQDTWLQHGEGLTPELTFNTTLGGLRTQMARAPFRAVWGMIRHEFAIETVAFVDRVVSETPLIAGIDLAAQFRDELAKLPSTQPAAKDRSAS